jgi:hypothetical protein
MTIPSTSGVRSGIARGLACAWLAFGFAAPVPAQSLFGDPSPAIEVDPSIPLPPHPGPQAGVEFYVSRPTGARYAVDPDSLILQQGRLIRFTLIVTSRSGSRNVSHEAIRCAQGQRKLLAIGIDGRWSESRSPVWQPVNVHTEINRGHAELMSVWCAGGLLTGRSANALLERLGQAPGPTD